MNEPSTVLSCGSMCGDGGHSIPREADRQAIGRQADRQTDRQIDRQIDRQTETDGKASRQIGI